MKSKKVRPLPNFSAPEEFERLYVKPKLGRTLIVGSYITEGKPDRRKLYENVTGVDMRPGPGVDIVHNMEDPIDGPGDLGLGWDHVGFDHVECMSVLEHSRQPWMLAAGIERLMKPGATMHFSVPFIWRVHSHPSDYWRLSTDAVRVVFPNIDWKVLFYGDVDFHEGGKIPALREDGYLYIARSEVFGFGVKR